mgnify:FL=1
MYCAKSYRSMHVLELVATHSKVGSVTFVRTRTLGTLPRPVPHLDFTSHLVCCVGILGDSARRYMCTVQACCCWTGSAILRVRGIMLCYCLPRIGSTLAGWSLVYSTKPKRLSLCRLCIFYGVCWYYLDFQISRRTRYIVFYPS